MHIHSLPRGGALGANIAASPRTAVHKSSTALIYAENANGTFLRTDGSLQRHIHIKTSVPCFDFEMCSAHIYSMTSFHFEV